MINGTHVVIYSKDPEADRAFFRDVLKFPAIDAGHGWLIFAMPALEAAFHDSERNDQHELYLTCDDIDSTLEELRSQDVPVGDITQQLLGKAILFHASRRWEGWHLPTQPSEPVAAEAQSLTVENSLPAERAVLSVIEISGAA